MDIEIPFDIYESPEEIVIVIPLWWVSKNNIEIFLEKNKLIIQWERKAPNLKETLKLTKWECFWGKFTKIIELPLNIYFDKIHSKLTEDNILIIIIPKIIIPEKIKILIN